MSQPLHSVEVGFMEYQRPVRMARSINAKAHPTELDPLGALVNNTSSTPPLAWFWCNSHHAARILALGATDDGDWINDPPRAV